MIILLSVTSYLLDRATKFLVFQHLPLFSSVPIVYNVFYLVHIRNTGAAFGIFQDRNCLLAVLALVALAAMGILLALGTFRTPFGRWSVGLYLAGISGNLTDRLLYGSVMDIFDLVVPFFGHWPAFNMADSYICIATGLFLYDSLHEGDVRPPTDNPSKL
ncbi:MAG: signal peptidase II [Candidatus Xiphinematobacter sp.]|nr:MAG: signal peptidase II [Candidatus Xiphinematobacter sp.]